MVRNIKIPLWVKSIPNDVSTSVREIRRRIGETLFILLAEDRGAIPPGIDIVASPEAKDTPFYAAYFKTFERSAIPEVARIFFHGKILDPNHLPYEVGKEEKVFVFFREDMFKIFLTMEATVKCLNTLIALYNFTNTNEIIIATGREYSSGVIDAINKNIRTYHAELWGNQK